MERPLLLSSLIAKKTGYHSSFFFDVLETYRITRLSNSPWQNDSAFNVLEPYRITRLSNLFERKGFLQGYEKIDTVDYNKKNPNIHRKSS